MVSSFESEVIVPLYQYPVSKHTWQPLHDAIERFKIETQTYPAISKHHHLNFIIIVNPNSGPGVDPAGWLPDKRYTREIRRLTRKSNVQTVGYVRLDYCRRPLPEIEEDIRKYANWSNGEINANKFAGPNDSDYESPIEDLPKDIGRSSETLNGGQSGVGVSGIFFDETPNLYEETIAAYLSSAGSLVKSLPGLLDPRLIIHNPGTVPDPEYVLYWQQQLDSADNSTMGAVGDGQPTITTVFEESHALWQATALQARLKELLRYDRNRCCYMIHSVPPEATTELVSELRQKGRFIFITDICERPYEKWGNNWDDFVDAMAMNYTVDSTRHESTI